MAAINSTGYALSASIAHCVYINLHPSPVVMVSGNPSALPFCAFQDLLFGPVADSITKKTKMAMNAEEDFCTMRKVTMPRKIVSGLEGGDGDVDESSKSDVPQSHPLEHSLTFWFDNPSVKSRQTTWESSLRSVFTYSTVEEF
ncbi:unnamed protein product [Microthlaspi erraticum]|uniref:Uncharacterized protein n=1 Tax=Microthlaspi erraticum TaxID=1685480 RepID=A0A6D2KLN3_9BRAS|nr:unnamed protein product [Microthlaspi erraticum]